MRYFIEELEGNVPGLGVLLRGIFLSGILVLPVRRVETVNCSIRLSETGFVHLLAELQSAQDIGCRRQEPINSLTSGTCLLAWMQSEFPGYGEYNVDTVALAWAIRERFRCYRSHFGLREELYTRIE